MRGLSHRGILRNRYYIVSQDLKKDDNYALINIEFDTLEEAEEFHKVFLEHRKYQNQIIKGSEAKRFGFKLYKVPNSTMLDHYKFLTKYIYPRDVNKMTAQEKKSFRTQKRRLKRK